MYIRKFTKQAMVSVVVLAKKTLIHFYIVISSYLGEIVFSRVRRIVRRSGFIGESVSQRSGHSVYTSPCHACVLLSMGQDVVLGYCFSTNCAIMLPSLVMID